MSFDEWLKRAWSSVLEKVRQANDWSRRRRRYAVGAVALAVLILLALLWTCQPRSLSEQAGRSTPGQPGTAATGSGARGKLFLPLVMSGGPDAVAQALATPAPKPSPTPAPTATRVPTPTPAPPTPTATPFPGPIVKDTKMGVGVYTSGGGFLIEAIYRLRPSVILLMDPTVEFAREVRKLFPRALIIGRHFVKDQPLDNPEQRGAQFADQVARLAVPLKGVVDAWVSYNEITDNGNLANYRAYDAFQAAFARRLQGAYGIAAVAGNDAAGTVQPEDYAKHFREAIESSKYFGIHAYAPKGAKSLMQEQEHYALRYRLINDALTMAGVQHGPFILTETGLWDGWRGWVSEEQMARDFMWLSDEMDKDDYVVGQTIFGIFDRDEWQSFDLLGTSLPDRLGKYRERVK